MRHSAVIVLIGLIVSCQPGLDSYRAESIQVNSSLQNHPADSIIVPYRLDLQAKMNEVLGLADSSLVNRFPEGPLGNFAADLCFGAGFRILPDYNVNTDSGGVFSLLNFGGLRTTLNRGEVTVGDIYELMPFDNLLTFVKLDSAGMRAMCEYLKKSNGQPIGNLRINYHNGIAYEVGTSAGAPRNEYWVITSDYLANGGDKMDFLKNASTKIVTGVLLRDLFIQEIRNMQRIPYYPVQGRIVLE